MTEIGSISKLLDERLTTFATHTADMIKKFEDRLTPAFQKVFAAPDRNIVWTSVDSLSGTEKAVMVSGVMAFKVGDLVTVGETQVTIDETNISEYNKYVRFAFPIIMLELATVDELWAHIVRINKIGASIEVTAENLAKIMDKCATAYEEAVMNNPEKIAVLDSATKPTSILGFVASDLTDEQIRKLKLYENHELRTLN